MNKYLKFGIWIAVSVLVVAYIITQSRAGGGGDFKIYLGAAELLKEGKSCYNVWIHIIDDNYCGYSYSPFFALLLIPLTYLPGYTPQIFWLLLNVFFLYRIWKITSEYLNKATLPRKLLIWFSVLTLLLSIRFILHNFEMKQMTVFLVYSCLEAVYLARKGKLLLSGVILSLGIIIKILPIVVLPYLLYRAQFKAAMVTMIAVISFMLLPALFYGWEFNAQLHSEWWNTINPSNKEFITEQNIGGEGVQSLSSFVAAYLTESSSELGRSLPRNFADLKYNAVFWILNIIRLAFLIGTFYFLRTKPFTKLQSSIHTFWELSYILAITPLIFPHQQKYAFFFLMPATAYILFYLFKSKQVKNTRNVRLNTTIVVLFFVLAVLTTDGLIGFEWSEISQFYKTITLASFLLIFALAKSQPKYLNTEDSARITKTKDEPK